MKKYLSVILSVFALVNSQHLVEKVIVADQAFVDQNGEAGKQWVETFPDRRNGKNYAGIGYTYDSGMDDFISPKPYASWVLSGNDWVPPLAMPATGNWKWDEESVSWKAWAGFPQ